MNTKGAVLSLLKDKNYLCFWIATAFTVGASNILQFALALYVLELTGSGTVYASMLSIIVIPRIMLTPVAGVLGDKRDKVRSITALNALTALIIAAYAGVLLGGIHLGLWPVYLLVIVLEIIEVFYQAPESALLPEIVAKDRLPEAAALAKIDDGIVFVSCPIIASLVYKGFGLAGTFILIFCFLITATSLNFFIKTPYRTETPAEEAKKVRFWSDFREGIKVLRNNPFLRVFVLVTPLMTFSFSAVFSVTITHLLLEIYKVSEYTFASYRSITAAMVVIVPFFIIPVVRKYSAEKLVTTAALVVSGAVFAIAVVVYTALYQNPSLQLLSVYIIAILDCLTIAMMVPVRISVAVYYQKNVPQEFRARVIAVSRMLTLTAAPLGNIFYGFLSDHIRPHLAIFIAAAGIALCYPLYRRVFRPGMSDPVVS